MKTVTSLLRPFGLFLLFLFAGAEANAQCNASFTYTMNGNTVYFTSTSTGVNNGTFYYWTFGNSGTGFGQSTQATYSQSGMYVVCLVISDSMQTCTDQYCDTITIGTNGIADASLPVDVKATPNPFSDKLHVGYTLSSPSPVTITITDMLGREVKKLDIEKQGAGAQAADIDSAELAGGTYLLQVKTDYGKTTQLLIKN